MTRHEDEGHRQHVAGFGVALASEAAAGTATDTDALTLAIEAAREALGHSGLTTVDRVLAAVPVTAPNDVAIFLAAAGLSDDIPFLRVASALDALDLAGLAGLADGTALLLEADHAVATGLLLAPAGYAEIGPVERAIGGAAIVDPKRDPRFARLAGGRALARAVGATAVAGRPLLSLVDVIDAGGTGIVAGGGEGAVVGVHVSASGPAAGQQASRRPTIDAALAAPLRDPGPPAVAPRPRGATGVDPDGALLWRERRELLTPLGARCAACQHVNVPPAGAVLCRRCGGRQLDIVPVARDGTVLSFCVSTTLPRAIPSPSVMLYADLDDGVRWKALGTGMGQGDLHVGDRVQLVTRRLGLDEGSPIYGLAFRKVAP